MAASWNGGTAPEAAVNRASSDQSRMAPEPIRVAVRIVMESPYHGRPCRLTRKSDRTGAIRRRRERP